YERAIEISPQTAGSHNNLGLAWAAKGEMAMAIKEYYVALAINPNYEKAHYNLAVALIAEGRLDEAIAHLKEALRLKLGWATAARLFELQDFRLNGCLLVGHKSLRCHLPAVFCRSFLQCRAA